MLQKKSLLLLCSVPTVIGGVLALFASVADPALHQPGNGDPARLPSQASAASLDPCAMHAQAKQEHPGGCPIDGTDPVLHSSRHDHGASAVAIAPEVRLSLGIRTHVAHFVDMPQTIETIGKITRIDSMGRRVITPPIAGELIDIAEKRQGDPIAAGDLLFAIRSDALFDLEKAFQDASMADDTVEATRLSTELTRMGLRKEQIARLEQRVPANLPVQVFAPEDGFVYTRRGRVGERVHDQFTVFNIGGNGRVIHLTAEIFERQWGKVKVDQKARITVRGVPGVVFEGTVVRVEPPVGYTTRSLEVGIEFKTDHPRLSSSQFAHVSIEGAELKHRLMVPVHSVIRTGRGDRVVVQLDQRRFAPVDVVTGEEAGTMIEILSGIAEGDRVVASGQFLVDSESHLQTGLERLTHHHGEDGSVADNRNL